MLDSGRSVAPSRDPRAAEPDDDRHPEAGPHTAAERGLTIADFLVPIALAERLNARVRHIVADRRRRAVHLS